jgi:hypothetical protein
MVRNKMTEKNNSFDWADSVTLKEFFLHKLSDQEKALNLARENLENRLEGMNEFRVQLEKQASKFITREEHEVLIRKYDEEIKSLNRAKDILEGKASQLSVSIAQGIAVISLIIGMVTLIHGLFK